MASIKCLSVKEIASELKLGLTTIKSRIRMLKLNHEFKINNTRYFSIESYYKIKEIDKVPKGQKLTYYPFRIETVYHIYESKMNYLNLD